MPLSFNENTISDNQLENARKILTALYPPERSTLVTIAAVSCGEPADNNKGED
ncbi:hypothetical protein T12_4819 [Trichinella patagoniensis]|uniref:Uncharacterized protein n=1 Tax=Trichinella patagoniensis TaxID=990121 RepID=A0A0V0Z194_9BILA|nr:hypothetical protein T12_4819 [Trichinella patagoniensis]